MCKLAILVEQEFLRIFLDKFIPRPILFAYIVTLAAGGRLRHQKLRMAVMDRNGTPFSRRLLAKLQTRGYLSLATAIGVLSVTTFRKLLA